MGITKLKHIGESPGGNRAKHLKKAIEYIMNPAKTCGGIFVFTNCGAFEPTPDGILQTMLETKEDFQKMDGRQGYHFIISLKPGEGDVQSVSDICQEFCDQFLADLYDYVFAVHNDQEHLHGHIIFNSVSRITGLKYHYSDGDWEKYIQPITDAACMKRGYEKLEFERARKKGTSYGEWASRQTKGFSKVDIMRADIDQAISLSNTYIDFKHVLMEMGYRITREGIRKEGGEEYLSLLSPLMKKAKRTGSLGEGYTVADIKERIQNAALRHRENPLSGIMQRFVNENLAAPSVFLIQTKTWLLVQTCIHYYNMPNPFDVDPEKVRREIAQLDRHLEECDYIERNQVDGADWLNRRMEELKKSEIQKKAERKTFSRMKDSMDEELWEAAASYSGFKKRLSDCPEDDPEQMDFLEDSIDALCRDYPEEMLQIPERLRDVKTQLKMIAREKRLIEDIQKTESRLHPLQRDVVMEPAKSAELSPVPEQYETPMPHSGMDADSVPDSHARPGL